MRRPQRPLNRDAVRAANAAVAGETGGRPLTMGPEDAQLRRRWLDAYEQDLARQQSAGGDDDPPDAELPAATEGMVEDTEGDDIDPDNVCVECGATRSPEPEDSAVCKVEVLANPLGSLFGSRYYHLHLKVTRADGSIVGMRGGPSASGPGGSSGQSSELGGGASRGSSGSNSSASDDTGPYGTIVTEITTYDEGFIDYPEEGQTLPSRVVADGPEVCARIADLATQIRAIQATNTRYNPLGPNSNTTVTTALENAGFSTTLPAGVWAPGSDQRIDASGID